MYPQLGPSLTDEIYDSDITLLKGKLAGNFIRGSHYPQDPRFLDRCDENGLLVW
jgi:beta-glucuronidase